MSVLSHVFEKAGLATVGISNVRGQAESARPPRMLHCQFPLGRPLGKPNDADFQTKVIRTALALLDRTDVPVLEDYPEVIEDLSDEATSCPLPPRHNPDIPAAIDEANGLRNAYDRNIEATGNTLVGRLVDADGVVGLIEKLIEIEGGASLESIGWSFMDVVAVGQDIRAYYEEAGLQLADNTGARQLETWFYKTTQTGQLVLRVRDAMKERGENQIAHQYIAPMTQ